jgi:hypothetical protein
LFTVTFKNRAIFLGFDVKVLLQAHIFAAFSEGFVKRLDRKMRAAGYFFIRASQ